MRIRTLTVLLAAWGTTGVQAAGFALIEQNASGLGNAYAGQAASAQDASTIFFNPAGMTEIRGRQFAGALHYIKPSAEFLGSSTISPVSGPAGDAGESALVPNAYFSLEWSPDLRFGLGLNAPFGLATKYDSTWAGRTQAIKSDVKTYNINPSLAWRINDRLSLGVGLDWQRLEAELSNSAGAAGVATVRGDDDAWGYNLGLMIQLDDASRLGISYRSRVKYHLGGTVSFSALPALNGAVNAAITLPSSASLAYFRKLDEGWDVLADVTWTGWGIFNTLAIYRDTGALLAPPVDESWQDTLRLGLGVNYHRNARWTWRFGLAYDETPVPDPIHRTPRIPDQDRTWLAVGAQYKLSEQSSLDAGYAHLFVKDAAIAHTESGVTLSGNYDNAVDILSVQYTHSF